MEFRGIQKISGSSAGVEIYWFDSNNTKFLRTTSDSTLVWEYIHIIYTMGKLSLF